MCKLDDERDFPIDVEYIFIEIINALRPNFKFSPTLTQANELVNDLEKEYRDNLTKSLKQNNEELQAIGEEDDDGEYDDEDSDSYNQNDEELIRNRNSQDFEGEGETEEAGGKVRNNSNNNQNSANSNPNGNQSSDDNETGAGGAGGELSDREDVVLQTRPSVRQVTQEDEEFIKAFESVVTENIVVLILFVQKV